MRNERALLRPHVEPGRAALDRASLAIAADSGFDFLGEEYRALFVRARASAFQHPIWLDRFYARLAPERGAEKLVLTGRDSQSGDLLFVLPMIGRRKWGINLLEAADLGVSDYAAPVIDHAWPGPDVARMVGEHLPAYDLLRIRPVLANHASDWRMFFNAEVEQLDFSAHAVGLSAPHASWRSDALTPSFTKYLDRKKKRLFKSGDAGLRLLRDPAEIASAVAAIQKLRRGRFEGDPIQNDFVRDFYADIAMAGAQEDLARTYALMLDGEAIGFVFGLTHAGRFHYLLIGCDYGAHGRHSPGLVMYDLIIEDWLASGGDCFDFTIGDEPFKRDFGAEPTPIYALLQYGTPRGRLAAAGFNLRRRLRHSRFLTRAE